MMGNVESGEKRLEESRQALRIDAAAGVADLNLRIATRRARSLKSDSSAVACEFDRIQEQMIQAVANFLGIQVH